MPQLDRITIMSSVWLQLMFIILFFVVYNDGLVARMLVLVYGFKSVLNLSVSFYNRVYCGISGFVYGFVGLVSVFVTDSISFFINSVYRVFGLLSLVSSESWFALSNVAFSSLLNVRLFSFISSIFLVLLNSLYVVSFDNPDWYQLGFGDYWTTNQAGISHLYYDLMIIFIVVLNIVIITLGFAIYNGYNGGGRLDFARVRLYHYVSFEELISNPALEIAWTFLPIFILFIMSFPIFSLIYSLGVADGSPDIIVHLVASQWMWEVQYFFPSSFRTPVLPILPAKASPDIEMDDRVDLRFLETTRPIRLFVNQKVQFVCTSTDVIHSFSVIGSGIKLDCTPGRLNSASIKILRSGVFYGACYELCGVGHSVMPISIHVFNDHV